MIDFKPPLVLLGSLLAGITGDSATAGLIEGTTTDHRVRFVSALNSAPIGTFPVQVSTPGERAKVLAGTAQTASLAADETLTINGIDILLDAGWSQTQVITQINSFMNVTQAFADVDTFTTRIYSLGFGASETVFVQSDLAAAPDSSGFGTTLFSDSGVDVQGSIGGVGGVGIGDRLVAQDITLQILADGDITETAFGSLGDVITRLTVVPEPASVALFGMLLGCTAMTRSRRRALRSKITN